MGLLCDIISLKDEELEKCYLLAANQTALYAHIQDNPESDWMDIDKTWHGINFMLTKINKEYPYCFLMSGGKTIQEIDWSDSYGVDVIDMRGFTSDEVKKINLMLQSVSEREFRRQYNAAKMNSEEIYPRIWEKNILGQFITKITKHSTGLNYLTFHFGKLKEAIDSAAGKNLAFVIKYHQ